MLNSKTVSATHCSVQARRSLKGAHAFLIALLYQQISMYVQNMSRQGDSFHWRDLVHLSAQSIPCAAAKAPVFVRLQLPKSQQQSSHDVGHLQAVERQASMWLRFLSFSLCSCILKI